MELLQAFPSDVTSVAVSLLAVSVVYLLYNLAVAPAFKLRHIPGPPFRPLVGQLPDYIKHEMTICHKTWAKQYGSIWKFWLGHGAVVATTDPEVVKQVTVKQFSNFHDRPTIVPNEVSAYGLVFSKGGYWAGARSAVMPLFHSQRLESYAPAIHASLDVLCQKLQKAVETTEGAPAEVDFLKWTQLLATDVIGRSAFGVEFRAQEDGDQSVMVQASNIALASLKIGSGAAISTSLGVILGPTARDVCKALLLRIPGTVEYKGLKARNFLADIAEQTGKRTLVDGEKADKADFITYMYKEARVKDSGQPLKPKEIRGLALEFMIAGSETTATTIAMAAYFLAQNKEAEQKLVEELRRNAELGLERPGFADLSKFSYTKMVLEETLRLFPPAVALTRVAVEDCQLGGYSVPAGTTVFLCLEAMHHDPKHFPDPQKFRPERFDPASEDALARHPYAYLPFGLGPRMCVGFKFAQEEAMLALIRVYSRFTFTLAPGIPTWPPLADVGIVQRPVSGVRLLVQERK